jgi:hypothetical protein
MPEQNEGELALVEVRVYHRGVAYRTTLRVSDEVSDAFVRLLLNEAVERTQAMFGRASTDRWKKAEVAGLNLHSAELKAKLAEKLQDAPPLPTEKAESDLPARGGQCRAIVVERRSGHPARRRACGLQLDASGKCQGADRHVASAPVETGPDDLF